MPRLVARRSFSTTLSLACVTAGLCILAANTACSEDWREWRGPSRDGHSATKLPSTLADLKLTWSIPLADSYSGPLVFAIKWWSRKRSTNSMKRW
ncbi:MAG: hypothetical protein R3C53_18490 [Pirellulaceae bacterium]